MVQHRHTSEQRGEGRSREVRPRSVGEIDIVAKHKGVRVFVEVRSRTTSSFGPPYLSVTRIKQAHIVKNALSYLKGQRILNACWRIDIVSVKLDHSRKLESIELIENAVEDDHI
ncbi:MAG: YraN family protein [Candidatus Omnitrophica bacterium]|nr:YraN family protein [Candidatus Omnitrophota bacterium]